MKEYQVANFHGQTSDAYAYVPSLHGICSMHDTGFKVLSMKINYLAPFKYKHKHQKLAHENWLPRILSLHSLF
jgi:hypothetical protein